MIISHSKKFIYIHLYKTAGTSLKSALKDYDNYSFRSSTIKDKIRFLLNIYPKVYGKQYSKHINAIDLKKIIPNEIFENYYKFGFVRNPWDWQVSLYHYMLKDKSHFQHELIKKMYDFSTYIKWRVNNDIHFQKDYFYDKKGNCLVDFIGRFEKLEQDYYFICKQLNIKQKELPKLNVSNKKDYRSFYSDKTKDMVAKTFKKDIDFFKYEF